MLAFSWQERSVVNEIKIQVQNICIFLLAISGTKVYILVMFLHFYENNKSKHNEYV